MKLKEFKAPQGSDKWHDWRKLGIGASEMSVIMGSLPFAYEDVLDLWKKKSGLLVKDFIVTQAIQDGIDLEPEARDKFNVIFQSDFEPKCYTHPKYSFLRASLDGITKDLKHGVEIKCPSLTNFNVAKRGNVLDYYYTQAQQQMACADLDYQNYWVYRKLEGGSWIKIYRNEAYIAEIQRRGEIFWNSVETKKPCLPRDFGMDMANSYSQPFQAGEHRIEFIGYYKN